MFRFTSIGVCVFGLVLASLSHGQGMCQKGVGGGFGGGKPGMPSGGIGMSMQRPMPMPIGKPGMPNMGFMTQKPMHPMQMTGRPQMPQQMQPMPNGMQNLLAQQQWQQQQALLQQQWQQANQQRADPQQPATQESLQVLARSQSDAILKRALTHSNLQIRLIAGEELQRRGQNSAAIATASATK